MAKTMNPALVLVTAKAVEEAFAEWVLAEDEASRASAEKKHRDAVRELARVMPTASTPARAVRVPGRRRGD
jgi:hypothetical protein